LGNWGEGVKKGGCPLFLKTPKLGRGGGAKQVFSGVEVGHTWGLLRGFAKWGGENTEGAPL